MASIALDMGSLEAVPAPAVFPLWILGLCPRDICMSF